MRVAYFDCFSGISGNMILGALIDAGLDVNDLGRELAKLKLDGYAIEAKAVQKNGIAATLVDIPFRTDTHRHLSDIEGIIESSSLATRLKETSKSIFRRLAEAEAHVHATTPERVHFHEVGAIDAIIDIVGAVIGLDLLGIDFVVSSPIPLGSGWVETGHGRLPVPAPATVILLQDIPVKGSSVEAELVTPTGAAIISVIADRFGPQPDMLLEQIGYGAGHRDLAHPNVLRVMIGHLKGSEKACPDNSYEVDTITVVECNIDDMNPEFYEHVMNKLLQSGALDVFFTPIQMKRNRPATMLTVLASPESVDTVLDILFAETTTLGVRLYDAQRRKLPREEFAVELPQGAVRVKVSSLRGKVKNVAPEYADCRKIADETNLPIKEIYDEARNLALDRLALRFFWPEATERAS